jgi:hypothetical protein
MSRSVCGLGEVESSRSRAVIRAGLRKLSSLLIDEQLGFCVPAAELATVEALFVLWRAGAGRKGFPLCTGRGGCGGAASRRRLV